jgi:molybdate transport system substrate-binding protein
MRRRLAIALATWWMAAPAALAAELEVMSAGAMEPGLGPAVRGFSRASGQAVQVRYGTAPMLQQALADGEAPQLMVGPESLMVGLVRAGRLAGEPVALGRVGVGVVTRPDLAIPPVADAEGLRRLVSSVQSVVFNRASTGLYMERLFERLELGGVVAPKARRYRTGAEVMAHLLHGTGPEVGFAPITEIRATRELRYVGPLPPELQSYTTYSAALTPEAPAAAEALLRWLTGPEALAAYEAAGLETAMLR